MKKTFPLILILLSVFFASNAQNTVSDTLSDKTQDTVIVTEKFIIDMPRRIIGFHGGVNYANLKYSHTPIDNIYSHFGRKGLIYGFFLQLPLGHSPFSLRPEISLATRGDSLNYLDVNYGVSSRYVDIRLPLTMNFRFGQGNISPFLLASPIVSLTRGGVIGYQSEDYPIRVTVPIAKSNMNSFDFSLMVGGGIDFTINTDKLPIYVTVEGGYNFGLVNSFAEREIVGNDNPSIIANPFFDASLWHNERYNRGLEVALRVGLPLDSKFLERYRERRKATHDTMHLTEYYTDTVIKDRRDTIWIQSMMAPRRDTGWVRKECYTISELYTLLEQGADITGKRICMFDIKFDFDSYKIRKESEQPLNELVRMMWDYPQMTIEVYGHTDSIGTPEYNQKLSENRANAVVEYISNHGVSPSRIKSFGYGLRYPIESNSTEEGRFRNRRVEFDVITIGIKRKYN